MKRAVAILLQLVGILAIGYGIALIGGLRDEGMYELRSWIIVIAGGVSIVVGNRLAPSRSHGAT